MSVTVKGLDDVLRKIDSLGKPGASKRPMQLSVDHLHGKMAREPGKAPGAFSAMATPGQKRAYWAKVSSGEARHGPRGYIRSHRLYRGWKKRVLNNGRRGEIWNDARGSDGKPYWEFVEGLRQQPFHAASNYPHVAKVVRDEARVIIGIFQRHYERLLR